MPSIDEAVRYSGITQDEATRRIQNAADQAKAQYSDMLGSLDVNWNQNVASFRGAGSGIEVTGTLTVEPAQIVVHADLPFALAFLKGKIESGIRTKLEQILA
jgi:Putative polyhydroxyalkanoic acid system protein (PHA_gran_rgn)